MNFWLPLTIFMMVLNADKMEHYFVSLADTVSKVKFQTGVFIPRLQEEMNERLKQSLESRIETD